MGANIELVLVPLAQGADRPALPLGTLRVLAGAAALLVAELERLLLGLADHRARHRRHEAGDRDLEGRRRAVA